MISMMMMMMMMILIQTMLQLITIIIIIIIIIDIINTITTTNTHWNELASIINTAISETAVQTSTSEYHNYQQHRQAVCS